MSDSNEEDRPSAFATPVSPDPSPLQMKKDNDARELENALGKTALKLGMKIRVVADPYNWCFRIYARLLAPNECYVVDEEALYVAGPLRAVAPKAFADLLHMILEDLQLKLHDNMAAAMQKTDVRERVFQLSDEDKHTLHDMLMAAQSHEMRDYYHSEQGIKKVDKYQELVGRLVR